MTTSRLGTVKAALGLLQCRWFLRKYTRGTGEKALFTSGATIRERDFGPSRARTPRSRARPHYPIGVPVGRVARLYKTSPPKRHKNNTMPNQQELLITPFLLKPSVKQFRQQV